MSSSKVPRFSEAELESLLLWSVPDVFGADASEADVFEQSEIDEFGEELTSVLTVEEIEAMQKQAYDEAFAQGKKDGFQQGFDEGSKKGYEENLHLLQKQATELVSLLESLSEPFKNLDEEVEKELVKLAIAIATQIIRREIKLDPGQVVAAVKEAINVLPLASQKVSLSLHPEDAELVRSALALDEMSPVWGIVEDPLITRGGCKVNTEVSHVDATIENRLTAVVATVLGGERARDSMSATASDSLAVFPPSMEVRSGDMAPRMGEVEQRREQLPTTPRTEEVEQRREQLPRAPEADALADAGAVADDSMDGGGRATQGAVTEDKASAPAHAPYQHPVGKVL